MYFQHYRQNFDDWQQIRQEFLDEEAQKFRDKITLQKELIRRQDELHDLRQREEEDELTKVCVCHQSGGIYIYIYILIINPSRAEPDLSRATGVQSL